MNTINEELYEEQDEEQDEELYEEQDEELYEEQDEVILAINQYNSLVIERAIAICTSYNSGNGKYNPSDLPTITWANHLQWLTAYGLFQLSKNDEDVIDLINMKAVSRKHSLLLSKQSTGKYDFTNLMKVCTFVHSIETNMQQFKFKRESKTLKVDLSLLQVELDKLGLSLIIEEQTTRSGGVVTNYFYDVKTITEVE